MLAGCAAPTKHETAAHRMAPAPALTTDAAHPVPARPEAEPPASDAVVPPARTYSDDEAPQDVGDTPRSDVEGGNAVVHPLADWTEDRLEKALLDDPSSLGPMSIGTPNFGALFNAAQMPSGERWELVDPGNAWGTRETIDGIERAIDAVHAAFPGSPKAYIGHISARRGGPLSPHVSHQAGRDVDLSYYLLDGHRWYARANAENLDRDRTWALVRAFITETDLDLMLIDASIQALLREHALSIGEDPEWLDEVFRGVPGKRRALILHARGHATHLHVRFTSPLARETARRAYGLLDRHGLIEPLMRVVTHRARRGDTLGKLARRHGTTVAAIQRANGLRSTRIRAGQTYRLPARTKYSPPSAPIVVPPRRLPRVGPGEAPSDGGTSP